MTTDGPGFRPVKYRLRPRIHVSMPNMGMLRVEHTSNLLRWIGSGKYDMSWHPLLNKAPLDRARNECHQIFMSSSDDYLFFMDADTVPPVEALDVLLEADKDIISATVQTLGEHKGQPQLVPVALRWDESDPEDIGYKAYWGDGIEEVDIATLACTLIKRRVLEEVGPRAFQYVFDPGNKWGTDGYSEDFFFSRLAKEKGFRIFNHYGILCSHFKTFDTKTVNRLMTNAALGARHASIR